MMEKRDDKVWGRVNEGVFYTYLKKEREGGILDPQASGRFQAARETCRPPRRFRICRPRHWLEGGLGGPRR